MSTGRPLSIIIATFHSIKQLALTLESYAHQSGAGFEVIVVDDGADDKVRALCRRHTAAGPRQLDIKYVATHNIGRAAARNRGIRAADGDLILIADDGGLVEPGALKVLRTTLPSEVVFLERHGLLTFFGSFLTGATTRRLVNVLAHRPELGEVVSTAWKSLAGELMQLVSVEELREDLPEVLTNFAVEDLVWERLAPTVAKHGADLTGFSLPWIFGVSGYLCADRVAMLETGLADEAAREWDFEGPDLAYLLHEAGLTARVAPAKVFHQLRHSRCWPAAGVAALARLADLHPVDGWLYARFLAHESLADLAEIAAACDGSAPVAEKTLELVCRELAPGLARDLSIMWGRL